MITRIALPNRGTKWNNATKTGGITDIRRIYLVEMNHQVEQEHQLDDHQVIDYSNNRADCCITHRLIDTRAFLQEIAFGIDSMNARQI